MIHLDNHPHAFINTSGYVVQVAVFSEHNEELLQSIKKQLEENYNEILDTICCCDNGNTDMGWKWTGQCWQPPQPFPSWIWETNHWTSPVPMPTDGKIYYWNESTLEWLEVI